MLKANSMSESNPTYVSTARNRSPKPSEISRQAAEAAAADIRNSLIAWESTGGNTVCILTSAYSGITIPYRIQGQPAPHSGGSAVATPLTVSREKAKANTTISLRMVNLLCFVCISGYN